MQPTFVSRETSLMERERSRTDRETLLGQREGERVSIYRMLEAERRCEEMGLAGATVAPLWNPYREDASKGQVTSSCNPPPSSFVPSPGNKLRASLSPYRTAPFSPPLPSVLRFLEVTSFPRETICGYGGRGRS